MDGVWKNNNDNVELVSDSGKIILTYYGKAINIVASGNGQKAIVYESINKRNNSGGSLSGSNDGGESWDTIPQTSAHDAIFFVDTGFLFAETYELRRRLERRYDVEITAVVPELTLERQEDVFGPRLWRFDPDLCCAMRKVDPLAEHLRGREAWVTAIRRDQTPARGAARVVEWDERFELVKINPLVAWTRERVWDYIFERQVPYNPMHDRGFPSIGCTHCTRAVRPGEHERAGRWEGHEKTECGLHSKEEL